MTADDVLADKLAVDFPSDAAAVLERAPIPDTVAFLSQMTAATAAPVLSSMAPSISRAVLSAMDANVAANILEQMPTARAAACLRGIKSATRETILSNMDTAMARETRHALHYSADSIGALTEAEPVSVPEDLTVNFALDLVRENPLAEQVFVVDRSSRLVGLVSIGAIVAADPNRPIASIMVNQFDSLYASDDAATLLARPAWAKVCSLPVLDKEDCLVGTVNQDALQELADNNSAIRTSMMSLPMSLPMSLAELFWRGLIGMTDGLARTITQDDPDDR